MHWNDEDYRRKRYTQTPDDPGFRVVMLTIVIIAAALYVRVSVIRADIPESRVHVQQTGQSLPTVRKGNDLIVSPLYVASLNPQTKFADWVQYRITPGLMDTGNTLSRNWKTELREDALEDADYEGSDYDRGHLVPLDSVSASPAAWTVNRLEVIVPQLPDLNRGVWYRLEQRQREIARADDEVLVTVGSLYRSRMKKLPNADEEHRVPSHFWMRLKSKAVEEIYVIDQKAQKDADLQLFRVTEIPSDAFPVE